MSGLGLTLGHTRQNETGEAGDVVLETPADVPEVALGYWWSPSMAVGLESAAFVLVEGNGHATFNQLPLTAASFPTTLTENGQVQCRMRPQADANPSRISTLAAVQAGWTGDTYVGAWIRRPGGGAASGNGSAVLQHHTQTPAQIRRLQMNLTTGVETSNTAAADGTAYLSNQWTDVLTSGNWTWLEFLIQPGAAVDMYADFVLKTRTATATPAATLLDPAVSLWVANRAAIANSNTTDFALVVYCPGIPSLGNRIALSRWRAPV